MPAWLDLSDALLEPAFQDTFDVRRRTDNINQLGVTQIAWGVTVGVSGMVAPTGNNDLERVAEAQRQGKTITIITNFRLEGPAVGKQPDVIIWPSQSGDAYLIAHLEDFSSYGEGFVQAICTSTDLVDVPPAP